MDATRALVERVNAACDPWRGGLRALSAHYAQLHGYASDTLSKQIQTLRREPDRQMRPEVIRRVDDCLKSFHPEHTCAPLAGKGAVAALPTVEAAPADVTAMSDEELAEHITDAQAEALRREQASYGDWRERADAGVFPGFIWDQNFVLQRPEQVPAPQEWRHYWCWGCGDEVHIAFGEAVLKSTIYCCEFCFSDEGLPPPIREWNLFAYSRGKFGHRYEVEDLEKWWASVEAAVADGEVDGPGGEA